MDIKNLPKAGLGFKASLNKPGAPSLQKALNRLAYKSSAFRNLSKSNVATIAKVVKPAERSIRLKGGMSRWQVKSATRKLWKAYKTTKGTDDEFSKQDVKDAKEILGVYKRDANKQKDATKKVIPFRPYLEDTPKIGMGSINDLNQHVGSISSITDRHIGSIKTEDVHNIVSVGSLTNPTHTVSASSPTTVARPTGLFGRIGGMFGGNKGIGGGLPSSSVPKPGSQLKF